MTADNKLNHVAEEVRRFINDNLPALIQNTVCNTFVLSILKAERILTYEEIEQLQAKVSSNDQSFFLYKIIPTRTNGVGVLAQALDQACQSEACAILCGGLQHVNVIRADLVEKYLKNSIESQMQKWQQGQNLESDKNQVFILKACGFTGICAAAASYLLASASLEQHLLTMASISVTSSAGGFIVISVCCIVAYILYKMYQAYVKKISLRTCLEDIFDFTFKCMLVLFAGMAVLTVLKLFAQFLVKVLKLT